MDKRLLLPRKDLLPTVLFPHHHILHPKDFHSGLCQREAQNSIDSESVTSIPRGHCNSLQSVHWV